MDSLVGADPPNTWKEGGGLGGLTVDSGDPCP